MLPQCSHITRKRGIYYYRRRMPHPIGGEIAFSLRTRHFRTAEHLAEMVSSRWNGIIEDPMIEKTKLAFILRSEMDRLLSESKRRIVEAPYGQPVFTGRFDGSPREALAADLEGRDWAIKQLSEDLAHRDLRGPENRIRALMGEHGIPDEDFREFGLAWLRMYVEFLKKQRNLLADGPFDLDELFGAVASALGIPTPPVPAQPVQAPVNNGPVLSALLPKFITLMVSTNEWTGQTEAQNTATYRMFIQVCGDRPLAMYSRKDCAEFFDILRGLPSLYSKKPEWLSLPLRDIVAKSEHVDVERLSMKTIKRHFSALGRLFEYFRKRGEYEGENPAHGFDFPTGRVRASDKRQMWEGEALRKLFSSPLWTGCSSPKRRSKPGTLIIKDEKYWLPLLGLYHGNRLEEFAQLMLGDITQEGDIWCFDINDEDDKQVKNAQSRRKVPLHPTLIKMGFLDYRDTIASAGKDRLFPNLKPGGPDRKLGYYFSKWFTLYRQTIGVFEVWNPAKPTA